MELHLVEGEKCADRLRSLGLLSTTSQGGSGRAGETDGTAVASFLLAGGWLICWPDVDDYARRRASRGQGSGVGGQEQQGTSTSPAAQPISGPRPGEKYVRDVVEAVLASGPGPDAPASPAEAQAAIAERIIVVDLRAYGLIDGEDVYDITERIRTANPSSDNEAIKAQLTSIRSQFGVGYRALPLTFAGLPAGYQAEAAGVVEGARRKRGKPDKKERPSAAGASFLPSQPAPLGPAGAGRGVLANFRWETRYKANKKRVAECEDQKKLRKDLMDLRELGRLDERSDEQETRLANLVELYKAEMQQVHVARTLVEIRDELYELLKGWPQCMMGSLLFADRRGVDAERVQARADLASKSGITAVFADDLIAVRELDDGKHFEGFLKEYLTLKFNGGQDVYDTNYCSIADLCVACSTWDLLPQWQVVEYYPHYPPIERHYYTCASGVDGYTPNGETLAEFLLIFDSVKRPEDRAILAAACLTPFWGGPYGQRPMFMFSAETPNSGKSTAAQMISMLAGGYLSMELEEHAEARVKERLLDTEGLKLRCVLLDNLAGTIESGMLMDLVTGPTISGKRLYHGECRRPNTLTFFMTANTPVMKKETALRAFFADFSTLDDKEGGARANWGRDVAKFMRENAEKIRQDIGYVLGLKMPKPDWGGMTGERFSVWVEDVLWRVLHVPALAAVINDPGGNLSLRDVLTRNQARRADSDDDLEQAGELQAGFLERVCKWRGYVGEYSQGVPDRDVFVRVSAPDADEADDAEVRNNLRVWMQDIMGRKELNPKWVTQRLNDHIANKRFKLATDEDGSHEFMYRPRAIGGSSKSDNDGRGKDAKGRIARGFYISLAAIKEYVRAQKAPVTEVTG